MDITAKTIVLTGASSGFGRNLLDKLVNYPGTKIIAVARNVADIPGYEGKVSSFACDLSKKEEIDRLFDFVTEKFGLIDIFIANAGFAYYEKMDTADWQHIQNIFDLNVISPLYSLQKIAMQKRRHPVSFVLLASAGGLIALPGFTLYTSSKFALNGFAEAYKYECDKNLKFSIVYPIAARTNFFKRSADNTPIPFPTQSVDAVTNSIIKAIKMGKRKVYPSKLFRYAYPVLRAFPSLIALFQRKQSKDFHKWLNAKNNM
ncbi:MAG: SDR family NAD(P)-dependent oxidoreductase [Prevotellaceae bacterium]|jgi:short-subunit dehydrogenase|nr:SDR family NAD(P)-dependent oxidoreductase [Prevotellaceae bacterium]